MKKQVQALLKQRGLDIFTEQRYRMVVEFMKLSMKHRPGIKTLLNMDRYYKEKFLADHMARFVEEGTI